MVKEIDGYAEEQRARKKFDTHFRVASGVFSDPNYKLKYYDGAIEIHFTRRFRFPVAYIHANGVIVSQPEVYRDAIRFAEQLERELGKEITLKTTYPRTSEAQGVQATQRKPRKPSFRDCSRALKEMMGIADLFER